MTPQMLRRLVAGSAVTALALVGVGFAVGSSSNGPAHTVEVVSPASDTGTTDTTLADPASTASDPTTTTTTAAPPVRSAPTTTTAQPTVTTTTQDAPIVATTATTDTTATTEPPTTTTTLGPCPTTNVTATATEDPAKTYGNTHQFMIELNNGSVPVDVDDVEIAWTTYTDATTPTTTIVSGVAPTVVAADTTASIDVGQPTAGQAGAWALSKVTYHVGGRPDCTITFPN